ncbi:MAG: Mannosyltransferase [Microgenomates bacterium OLB23]|nr:MAG: Mannosyltransferase [Microgenomates bacterium OLB23]
MLKRYVAIRYAVLLAVAAIARVILPFSSQFTYASVFETKLTPHYVGMWANFDGEHYLRIAREGYHGIERAFFPLWPLLINAVHKASGLDMLIVGVILSQVFLLAALLIMSSLLQSVFRFKHPHRFIALLLLYPTSFYFSAVYTEALFLLLVSASLLFMYKKYTIPLIITLILASLTRIQGVFFNNSTFLYFLSA